MATFSNTATLTYNDRTIQSNTVTGEITPTLGITKTAVGDRYAHGDTVTYAVSVTNSGDTAYTAATLTDNLGAYPFGTRSLVPLTYVPGSLRLYQNGVLQTAPVVSGENPLVIDGITVPAGGNVLIVYATRVNQFAPLGIAGDNDASVTNTATLTDALLAALGRQSDFYAAAVPAGNTHRGDLYEMLYPAGKMLEEDFAYAPGFSFTANTDNPDRVTITTENAAGNGALLCYRDSFGRNLYPYLAESFAAAEFSRRNEYTGETLPEGGTLVIELVERNLRYLVEYDSLAPAPVRELSFAEPAAEGAGRALLTESAGTEGYTVFSGTWDGVTPDDDSAVYVLSGGTLYEAVPRPDGFILSLPDGSALDAVYAAADGSFFRLSAVYAID